MSTISEEIFIQKVTVEVTTASTETAKSVESNIHTFLENRVFPQIEKWLSENVQLPPHYHLQLSDLSLSIAWDPRQLDSEDSGNALSQVLTKQLMDQMQGLLTDSASSIEKTDASVIHSVQSPWGRDPHPIKDLNNEYLSNLNSGKYRIINDVQKGFYAWLHFLQFGSKPWFAIGMEPKHITYAACGKQWILLKEFKELTGKVLVLPQALHRLVLQHGEEEIVHLMGHIMDLPTNLDEFHRLNKSFDRTIQHINRVWFLTSWLEIRMRKEFGAKSADSSKHILALFDDFSIPDKAWAVFWNQVSTIYGFQPPADAISSLVMSNKSHLNIKSGAKRLHAEAFQEQTLSSKSTIVNQDTALSDLDRSLPVLHAGLILIHPFLRAFFQDVGVLGDEKKIVRPVLGMHLLHYVATGRLKPFEFELGFEKFLVGWDGLIPFKKQVELTVEQLDKCDLLLESLMENWKKLKNTGKETVRNGFLQREGTLLEEADGYRLVVERKAQDVLLNGLPFTLGVVKLPWQKKLVFVEW